MLLVLVVDMKAMESGVLQRDRLWGWDRTGPDEQSMGCGQVVVRRRKASLGHRRTCTGAHLR